MQKGEQSGFGLREHSRAPECRSWGQRWCPPRGAGRGCVRAPLSRTLRCSPLRLRGRGHSVPQPPAPSHDPHRHPVRRAWPASWHRCPRFTGKNTNAAARHCPSSFSGARASWHAVPPQPHGRCCPSDRRGNETHCHREEITSEGHAALTTSIGADPQSGGGRRGERGAWGQPASPQPPDRVQPHHLSPPALLPGPGLPLAPGRA